MTAMRAVRAGSAGQVRTLARSTNVFSLLSLLVVILGFGVMGLTDPKYHTSIASTWIWLALVFYVVALALTLFAVVPAMRRAADRLEAEPAEQTASAQPPAGSSGYRSISIGSGVSTLLLLGVVVLMVWKPA
jgi:uncharacterized membrane protein